MIDYDTIGANEGHRSTSGSIPTVYLWIIVKLIRGKDKSRDTREELRALSKSIKAILGDLNAKGMSVNDVIRSKKNNAVLSCSILFIKHLSVSDFYYSLIKSLDDNLPMPEAVANFCIFCEAYAISKGYVLENNGEFSCASSITE